MCDPLEIFEFTEIDATCERNLKRLRRKRVREESRPLDKLNEREFQQRYRLTKGMVRDLCEELKPHMPRPLKSTDLSVETKVLVALSFFATGSYQRPTGDITGHSVSQSSVSTIIKEVTKLLNFPQIQGKYIKFPQTSEERKVNVQRFFNKFGIPNVLGCIDCTQVAIVRPSEHEERYYCRKQYHSMNVQLVCNADMEIVSVDASYGGATRDSFIWENHPLKQHIDELNDTESIWLLGDSGYPLRRYLMTPIMNTTPGTPEAHYSALHVRSRNVIEKTIGLLKSRFRCLHRVLHYSPSIAASIINACVVLHNMCLRASLSELQLTDEESAQDHAMQMAVNSTYNNEPHSSTNINLNQGLVARRRLVSCLWAAKNSVM